MVDEYELVDEEDDHRPSFIPIPLLLGGDDKHIHEKIEVILWALIGVVSLFLIHALYRRWTNGWR